MSGILCSIKTIILDVTPMKYYSHRGWRWHIRLLLSAPFIFAPFPVILVLDAVIELYHHVSFSLYKIPCNKRNAYIIFDRVKLSYLPLHDKFFCLYCSYVNGVFAYWVKIAADTEAYWCGIKHRQLQGYKEPEHHASFMEYGDEEAYRSRTGVKKN